MQASTGLLADYRLKIDSIEKLLAKIKQISSTLRYSGVERINRTALFHVEAKHTNEFTLHLGGEYYAEVRAEEAVKLLNVRLEGYREQLKKLQKKVEEKKPKEEKKQVETSKYGKEKTVKIEEEGAGGVKSYMELIGQENGEDIFNIVEIEGEEEISDFKTSTADVLKEIEAKIGALSNNKSEIAAPAPHPSFEPVQPSQTASVSVAPVQNTQEPQRSKSQKSQSEDSYSDDEGDGPTDLILYHREKIDKVPPKKELPPITEEDDKSKLKPIIHPALPADNPAPKKEKKVSFVEEPKPKKEKPKQSKKSDGLPEKISKFKLQKMKEKLMKE